MAGGNGKGTKLWVGVGRVDNVLEERRSLRLELLHAVLLPSVVMLAGNVGPKLVAMCEVTVLNCCVLCLLPFIFFFFHWEMISLFSLLGSKPSPSTRYLKTAIETLTAVKYG